MKRLLYNTIRFIFGLAGFYGSGYYADDLNLNLYIVFYLYFIADSATALIILIQDNLKDFLAIQKITIVPLFVVTVLFSVYYVMDGYYDYAVLMIFVFLFRMGNSIL